MNRIIVLCLFTFFSCGNSHQQTIIVAAQTLQEKIINSDSIAIKTLAFQFDSINTLVRDNKIEKAQAMKRLQGIFPELQAAYNRLIPNEIKNEKWIFPVEGYTSNSIGGTRGEGYVPNGYDYFEGNRNTGHPAHDIFIHDKNQDCKDDRTGKFVNVRSVSNGIAVAMENDWDSESLLRGGKYIWIYEPGSNSLFYYSHNNEVFVSVGQIINAGDTIATVGRTGLNAYKQRSPTHLHFMQLTLGNEYYPKPVDTYQDLLNAKQIINNKM